MKKGVSVVVCTYNGASLLPETIRHIAEQHVRPDIDWEVIIINNCSTDNTSGVVQAEWEKYQSPTPFFIFHQSKQGLAYARELGLEKAQFEFVLLCDDDNWLNPNYINVVYDLMLQNSTIGVLGGNGELLYESTPPKWALGHSIVANGPQAKVSGRVNGLIVYGAGCVIRKTALKEAFKLGFRSMLTDRVAGKLSAGGDYEICYATALAGYEIWYDERLKFKHFIPNTRISWDHYVRLVQEGVKSFEVLIPFRIRLKQESSNTLYFHLAYLWILLSYVLKLFIAYYAKYKQPTDSEELGAYELKVISLRCKIYSLMAYSSLKKNYGNISSYKKAKSVVDFRYQKVPKVGKVNHLKIFHDMIKMKTS